MPRHFFECRGVQISDVPFGYFLHDGLPAVAIFAREITIEELIDPISGRLIGFPMVMAANSELFFVGRVERRGWIRDRYHLALLDSAAQRSDLELPMVTCPKVFKPIAENFFGYIVDHSKLIASKVHSALPYLFAPNLQIVSIAG